MESQATKSSGERITSTFPLEAMQNLSERASEAPKAQHEPHYSWFLISWTQVVHLSLESKVAGTPLEMAGLWYPIGSAMIVPNMALISASVLLASGFL